MNMTKHTPTPFALPVRYNGSEVNTSSWIEDANGKRVCTMRVCSNDSDRAAFIVKAANAHDDLVAALKGLLNARGLQSDQAWAILESDAYAALAKAGAA